MVLETLPDRQLCSAAAHIRCCQMRLISGEVVEAERLKPNSTKSQHPLFYSHFRPHGDDAVFSPCIWTRNSVLIRRAASLSFSLLDPQRESISSMKMIDGLCSRARLKRFFTNLRNKRETVEEGQEAAWLSPPPHLSGDLHLLLTFSQPFGDQVRGGDGEEGWIVRLCGNSFGQIGLSCTWWSKKQDPPPGNSLSCERWVSIKEPPATRHHYWPTQFKGRHRIEFGNRKNTVPVKRWGNLIGRMTASFSASLAPSRPATSLHLMFGFSITMAPANIDTRLRGNANIASYLSTDK